MSLVIGGKDGRHSSMGSNFYLKILLLRSNSKPCVCGSNQLEICGSNRH
jgi:hypothetical protein